MKKLSISIFIAFTLFVYRTQIFNAIIDYVPEQQIQIQELTDSYWRSEIDKMISSKSFNGISELNDGIIQLITKRLQFGKGQITNDPNKFGNKSVAHCVGYSSLNASLLSYACQELNFEMYEVSHVRGKIMCLGMELTSLPIGNFYKDHDFVKIENKSINKYYFSDASLYELLKISCIQGN